MKFIVGLGNPGLTYRVTRHNVGFMAIHRLARKHGIPLSRRKRGAHYGEGEIHSERVVLAKPYTYMNRSGLPTKDLLEAYDCHLKDLLVIHDDLDLSYGLMRVRRGGGHGGHKGVQSIIQTLRGSDFVRLKVGIGRPSGHLDVEDYVLLPFEREEKDRLGRVLSTAVEAVETILVKGLDSAMNTFNRATAREEFGE